MMATVVAVVEEAAVAAEPPESVATAVAPKRQSVQSQTWNWEVTLHARLLNHLCVRWYTCVVVCVCECARTCVHVRMRVCTCVCLCVRCTRAVVCAAAV